MGYYLQEDGSSKFVLEDGSGDYLLEGTGASISLTDTGVAISDATASTRTRSLTDTGLSSSDSISATKGGHVALADTGATVTDTIRLAVARVQPTTTGLTLADSLATTRTRPVADTGAAVSDSLFVEPPSIRIIDTGLTISDTASKTAVKQIPSGNRLPEVGLNLTDGIVIRVNGGPPNSCIKDFRRFLLDLDASPEYAAWCAANPGDCSTWANYVAAILGGGSPAPPAMSTDLGIALVDAGVIALDGIVPCRAKPPPSNGPHAAFTWTLANEPLVAFTDFSTPGSSGPITAAHWSYGDGSTDSFPDSEPVIVNHTYAAPGTYTVTLTVTGSGPDGSASVTHLVTVGLPSATGIHIDAVTI